MAKRKKWSQLSARSKRIAVNRGDEYGLTYDQVRKRYDRGTYNPFARKDPSLRFPKEVRRYAEETEQGTYEVNWQEAATAHAIQMLRDYFDIPDGADNYTVNENTISENILEHTGDAVARIMYFASVDEYRDWARPQPMPDGTSPDIAAWVDMPVGISEREVGYYIDGKWFNVFWYH